MSTFRRLELYAYGLLIALGTAGVVYFTSKAADLSRAHGSQDFRPDPNNPNTNAPWVPNEPGQPGYESPRRYTDDREYDETCDPRSQK